MVSALATASNQLAMAKRELRWAAAANKTARSMRAGQAVEKSVRWRWRVNSWEAWVWTAERVRVYCMDREPPSWDDFQVQSHSQEGACVHTDPTNCSSAALGTTETSSGNRTGAGGATMPP